MHESVSLGVYVNRFPTQGNAAFSMERSNLREVTGANLNNMGEKASHWTRYISTVWQGKNASIPTGQIWNKLHIEMNRNV